MSGMGIKKFFDLSIRDQVEASIVNGGSDSFFLFSGPPEFASIAEIAGEIGSGDVGAINSLCPLLFTTSFQEPDPRPGRGSLATFGGRNTIAAPSTGNPGLRTISIGAMALVTGKPGIGLVAEPSMTGTSQQHWNLLKRCYWWALNSEKSQVQALFEEGNGFIGNQKEFPNAIAPDEYSYFGNFGRSAFYDIPIGIMALAINKGGVAISGKYYEGCTLLGTGAEMVAELNGPTIVTSTNGLNLSFADVNTFTQNESGRITGGETSPELRVMNAINAVLTS